MKAKNLAVMLTDIKGFTGKTSRKSRAEIKELPARHNELVLPVIARFNGRMVKTIGHAFLATFESSTDAVLCGAAVRDATAAFNKGREKNDRIDIRIAINAGEVSVSESGDISGDAVDIASRIKSIAGAGGVFFTEAVFLSMNGDSVPSSEIGYRQFKGVPHKIKLYKVLKEDPVGPVSAAAAAPEDSEEKAGTDAGMKMEEKTLTGMGGLSGMIMKALHESGITQDVDIEDETGKRIKITGGEIHVVKDGKEIHIGRDGIRIRRVKKDAPADAPKDGE